MLQTRQRLPAAGLLAASTLRTAAEHGRGQSKQSHCLLKVIMVENEIGLPREERLRRAAYLGARADRLFRAECARLGLDANEAIKSPLSSIIARQWGITTADDVGRV